MTTARLYSTARQVSMIWRFTPEKIVIMKMESELATRTAVETIYCNLDQR